MVSVSGPARWAPPGHGPDAAPALGGDPAGRQGGGPSVRPAHPHLPARPGTPSRCRRSTRWPLMGPVPLLVVHGDQDPYFPLDHPRMLAAAAWPEGAAELWIEHGMGHAENAAAEPLLARIGGWITRPHGCRARAPGADGSSSGGPGPGAGTERDGGTRGAGGGARGVTEHPPENAVGHHGGRRGPVERPRKRP